MSSISIPPGTAVTCPHGDPLPASAPRPVPAWQQLLLNQRRGPGCARGDFLSPCDREELRESPGPAPPAWGHDGSQRLAGTGQLGVPGVLEGPIFPQGSGGLTGCFGDLQPSPGSGVSCICRLVPRVPPSSRHVPPSLWVPRGAHCPLPGDPRPLSPPCAVPCHALPRCLGGHLSHIPPAPHPAETPGSGVRGAPSPG